MSEQEQRVKVPFSLEPIGIDMPNLPPILCSKCGDDIQLGSIDGLCRRCLMPQQESGPSKEEILSAELSSLRAEVERLRAALQNIGNHLGRPTTGYAAPSYQMGEMRQIIYDCAALVKVTLD